MDDTGAALPIPPETHYQNNGGVHIAYQVVGDGPIDLVFVMGWVTHLDYFWLEPRFARFLRRLASFARLILVDKRGTGLSDRAVGLPTLDERMDDIRAVLDAVGSRRAALMGHSEGGAMSILFAATYPERTTALVLVGTAPRFLWSADWPWGRTHAEIRRAARVREQGWGRVEWAMQDLARRSPSVANDAAFARWWAAYLRMGGGPGTATALSVMNSRIDTRAVLPAIRVPTLIIHRVGDMNTPVEAARYMAEHIPGAKYVELPGDDHLVFVGNQDEVVAPIKDLLGVAQAEAELETVLATVLAAEVTDPTQLIAAGGERRWRAVEGAFGEVVRRALEAHRGRALTLTGGRVLAWFDGPSRAIRCAQAIVRDTARLGVEARAGLHTGECQAVGGEASGLPLRVAAWVMAQAEHGELLASNTVRDLVAGSGIAFEDTPVRAAMPEPGAPRRLYRVDDRPRPATGSRGEGRATRHLPGGDPLTRREREVVDLLARGSTNREIAEALVISERTVENHVSNVLGKLGLETRAQVAVWALGRGETLKRIPA